MMPLNQSWDQIRVTPNQVFYRYRARGWLVAVSCAAILLGVTTILVAAEVIAEWLLYPAFLLFVVMVSAALTGTLWPARGLWPVIDDAPAGDRVDSSTEAIRDAALRRAELQTRVLGCLRDDREWTTAAIMRELPGFDGDVAEVLEELRTIGLVERSSAPHNLLTPGVFTWRRKRVRHG